MKRLWTIKKSEIHGIGTFASEDIPANTIIDIGIKSFLLIPVITYFGSKINHSYNPTTVLGRHPNGNYYVVSRDTILKDHEITVDYNKTPWFVNGPNKEWK